MASHEEGGVVACDIVGNWTESLNDPPSGQICHQAILKRGIESLDIFINLKTMQKYAFVSNAFTHQMAIKLVTKLDAVARRDVHQGCPSAP